MASRAPHLRLVSPTKGIAVRPPALLDPSAGGEGPALVPPREITERLRRGEVVADATFDQVFPAEAQYISGYQWTPLEVIERAVSLIAPEPETRVLDVGSGVGKFCLAASLLGPGLYTGVERQSARHAIANQAAGALGVDRVTFLQGDALDLDWAAFHVLYFFNPFQELVAQVFGTPGDGLPYGLEVRDRAIRGARDKLAALPEGIRVVVFHGLGDDLPPGFALANTASCSHGDVEIRVRG